jgi:hypothetical protein
VIAVFQMAKRICQLIEEDTTIYILTHNRLGQTTQFLNEMNPGLCGRTRMDHG